MLDDLEVMVQLLPFYRQKWNYCVHKTTKWADVLKLRFCYSKCTTFGYNSFKKFTITHHFRTLNPLNLRRPRVNCEKFSQEFYTRMKRLKTNKLSSRTLSDCIVLTSSIQLTPFAKIHTSKICLAPSVVCRDCRWIQQLIRYCQPQYRKL